MRRGRLVVLAATLLMVAAGCDWPMTGYGAGHTGYTPDVSISRAAAASGFNPVWRGGPGAFTTPAVVAAVAYVGKDKLYAFDAAGKANCSGTPRLCIPLWTGVTTGTGNGSSLSSPAVVDGVVYAQTGLPDNKLYAFDAAGKTNCSGTPRLCAPLWTATTGPGFTAPVVANGFVYVAARRVFAFDAHGITNCAGVVKTCQPLWVTPDNNYFQSPAVANGFVYAARRLNTLDAFDDDGDHNCSGVPLACTPLWTAGVGDHILVQPIVANSVVYAATYDEMSDGGHTTNYTPQPLYAFDANGTTNCSGAPKQCAPLWKTSSGVSIYAAPAVDGGAVYVHDALSLYAFDAAGATNCSGTPKTCTPLWRSSIATANGLDGAPSVANGVVYVIADASGSSNDGFMYTFDSSGKTNCSGTPRVCTPLSTTTVLGALLDAGSPAIVNGTVYVTATGAGIQAFTPKQP